MNLTSRDSNIHFHQYLSLLLLHETGTGRFQIIIPGIGRSQLKLCMYKAYKFMILYYHNNNYTAVHVSPTNRVLQIYYIISSYNLSGHGSQCWVSPDNASWRGDIKPSPQHTVSGGGCHVYTQRQQANLTTDMKNPTADFVSSPSHKHTILYSMFWMLHIRRILLRLLRMQRHLLFTVSTNAKPRLVPTANLKMKDNAVHLLYCECINTV